MDREVAEAVKRMRTQWDRSSKIVDERGEVRMDYISDLAIIADAYIKEHEADSTNA